MSILGIDTATMVSSVAVADSNRLLAELTVETRLTHSETLLPHVEQVLSMAGIKRSQLEAVAVSLGPGSFTGLRIGLATAKAIAYGLDIPLIGIPTMEVLAWHYPVPGVSVAGFIDAQKGNVYTAHYSWQDSELHEDMGIRVVSLDDALKLCSEVNGPVIPVGDMVGKKLARLDKAEMPDNIIMPKKHLVMPRAANVAIAGLQKLNKGEVGSVMDMEPIYIRRSEAEELWEKRQAKLRGTQE